MKRGLVHCTARELRLKHRRIAEIETALREVDLSPFRLSTCEFVMPHSSLFVIEPSEADFQQQVIERSHELPIVVDFWSPRCAPCLALSPLLEKAAEDAGGTFILAKVNCDESPSLAGAFGVSSIPAVFALREGKVVDHFLGMIGEANLKEWLRRIQPSEAEQLAAAARKLVENNPTEAEAKLRRAIELDPQRTEFQIDLARLLLAQSRLAEGSTIIDELAKRGYLEEAAQHVQAELALATAGGLAGGSADCREAAAKHPKDLSLQLKLAEALAGERQFDEALDICLAIVQQDPKGSGEVARQTMLNIFRVMGADDERTNTYRRKLASALY